MSTDRNSLIYRFWMWVARNLLPKGYGIIRVWDPIKYEDGAESRGVTCIGLNEEERDTVGINLVPVAWLNEEMEERSLRSIYVLLEEQQRIPNDTELAMVTCNAIAKKLGLNNG
ncbi:MAG TPA: hypothetical protein VJ742_12810 [Nitrososphaera sp.]|nr:hypothetical protein [Nitrososphaera sp.]